MASAENLADWRGKDLLDRGGEKIGKLRDVYVDQETDEPLFGTVKEGLIGRHVTFVPLAGATTSPDHVQTTTTKDRVKDAPNVDTDGELTADDEAALYDHYGLAYTAPATPKIGRAHV